MTEEEREWRERNGNGGREGRGGEVVFGVSLKRPTVYILASRRRGVLYVGVTSDLARRVEQHRSDSTSGFTRRYGVHRLVWAEAHETMTGAITREKAIKKWNRSWKVSLIERENPMWRNLAEEYF